MKYVNLEKIELIRELDPGEGQQLLKSLINMYLEATPLLILQMESESQKGAFRVLGKLAHDLKSTSANLGIQFISECGSKIEKICLDQDSVGPEDDKTIDDQIDKINEVYVQVKIELESLLNKKNNS